MITNKDRRKGREALDRLYRNASAPEGPKHSPEAWCLCAPCKAVQQAAKKAVRV